MTKEKIKKDLGKAMNTLLSNSSVNRNSQTLYKEAIEAGIKNKTMNIVNKNGKLYYEIKEPITFKNYGHNITGKFVLTKIDNNYRLFIVRPEKKAVAVPFGEFNNEKGKSPFDYIVKNEKIGSTIFTHNHFKSNGISSYMTKNEKRELAEYYAFKPNSQKVGEAILNYLKEGNQTLDEVSNIWSGSGMNRYNFGAEIEAHADLFLNKTLYTEILKGARYLLKNGVKVNESFDKEYYNSLGMADMAKSDSGKSDKILMDFIWGLPTDKQVKKWKESKEEYKNGNGFTR
jgi:hypothetical protein